MAGGTARHRRRQAGERDRPTAPTKRPGHRAAKQASSGGAGLTQQMRSEEKRVPLKPKRMPKVPMTPLPPERSPMWNPERVQHEHDQLLTP